MQIFAETAIWDEFGRIFYNFTGGGIHIFEDFMGCGVLTRKIVQTSCVMHKWCSQLYYRSQGRNETYVSLLALLITS